jgi:hypothetical protein
MDDPAPGRLDRLDGVTNGPDVTSPTVPVVTQDTAPDRPTKGAES